MEKSSKGLEELLRQHKDNKRTNGYVLYLHQVAFNKDIKKTCQEICDAVGDDLNLNALRLQIIRTKDRFNTLKKKLSRDWDKIIELLDQDFKFPLTLQTQVDLLQAVPSQPPLNQPVASQTSLPVPNLDRPSPQVSPIKTRSDLDCASCISKKKTNVLLVKANKNLMKDVTLQKKRQERLQNKYKVSKVNQSIRRKQAIIIKKNDRIKELKRQLSKVRPSPKTSTPKPKVSKEVELLKNKVKVLERHLKEKDQYIDYLKSLLEDKSPTTDIKTKKDSKQYASDLRVVIYRCLENNVAVEATSTIVKTCIDLLTESHIKDLPNPSTIARMGREMGILAELQVAEALLQDKVATLAFDATTLGGNHINEVHIATPRQLLTASIAALPGGCADDYVNHVLHTLQDVANSYAGLHNLDTPEILRQISGSILSTLTDRASVNHAAVVKLQACLEKDLLELHCHLHPLDGIANAVRAGLKQHNTTIKGASFGSDCRAANLLHAVSKLRYKAKGDPSGFKAFLRENGLPCGTFPRYVGNRLHIIFHLAGVVYQHKALLIRYLEKRCNNTSSLRTAVLEDLQHREIGVHLQALGLWGKLVTGPWMAVFYASETRRNHLDMVEYLKLAAESIFTISQEPTTALSMETDVFNRPLLADTRLTLLQLPEPDIINSLLAVLGDIARNTHMVMKRQLERYLSGPLSSMTESLRATAASAPLHNIWAERTLGIVDAQAKRAPNASITFLDAKTKVKMNKSVEWLCRKPKLEREKIVSFCVKHQSQKDKTENERKEQRNQLILQRLCQKGQKRDMAKRKKIAKDLKIRICEGTLQADNPHFNVCNEQRMKLGQLLSCFENKNLNVTFYLEHLWAESNADVIYKGKVLKLSGKKPFLTIAYWHLNEAEEDAEDSKLPLEDFLADFALGDAYFCL